MNKYFILWLFGTLVSLSAASFYSPSVEELNSFIPGIKDMLPRNAALQRVLHTQITNNTVHGVFVRCSLNGSAVTASNAEVLGIIGIKPDKSLYFHELVKAKPDSFILDNDAFFFDLTEQKILFSVLYEKVATEDYRLLQEWGVTAAEGNIISHEKTILKISDKNAAIRNYTQIRGRIHSYEVFSDKNASLNIKNINGGFTKVFEYNVNTPVFIISLLCDCSKYFYKYLINAETGLTQLYWLNLATCQFETTNLMDKFCSLFAPGNDGTIIVDPKNPKHILGQLIWKKGVTQPEWYDESAKQFFLNAEKKIRRTLQTKNHPFRNAKFDYSAIKVKLIDSVLAIDGSLHIEGCDDSINFYHSEHQTCLSPINPNSEKPSAYTHELVETTSKITGEPDTSVYYSLFKKPTKATNLTNAKKTLVYIPGGPWGPFRTNEFLKNYQPFINEGYTIIAPHEPLRDGFGYNYLLAEKQLGRRNLHHIMAILDDACNNKWANPQMVAMGESYGGWVASALAATWKDFKTPESLIELHGCIAQAADLDLNKWKDRHAKFGEQQIVETFADDPVNVAGITVLQSSLLIFHGTEDVCCTIDSMEVWADNLKQANQQFTFITAPEGHAGILPYSLFCAEEECRLRLNIVRRFIEGDKIPAASVQKLAEFNLSVVHNSAGLFEQSKE